MTLTIVADDLTGACDTGCLFTGDGPLPLAVWPAAPFPAPVRVVDTESRAVSEDEAAARVTSVPTLAPSARYFKKIDSTLRGHVGLEIDALMRAVGVGQALVCPAFPAQGRAVVERLLLVNGVAVAETPLARDPQFPALASSSVVDVLRPRIDRALAWLPLDQVRLGAASLARHIGRLAGTVVVADAETDADLDTLAEAALGSGMPLVLAGAAGLGRALAARLALLPGEVVSPPEGRWLIVAGSHHPASRAQAQAARDAGLAVLASPDEPEPDRRRVARRLAAEACDRLAGGAFDGVAVTGGETAVALCEALEASAIELIGAPRPGLALGRLTSRRHPTLPILTKAGGFGEPNLLVSMLAPALARGHA